eukprot:scaffold319427_cov23-Prasinocladus_malaysianus.AAC.1
MQEGASMKQGLKPCVAVVYNLRIIDLACCDVPRRLKCYVSHIRHQFCHHPCSYEYSYPYSYSSSSYLPYAVTLNSYSYSKR